MSDVDTGVWVGSTQVCGWGQHRCVSEVNTGVSEVNTGVWVGSTQVCE